MVIWDFGVRLRFCRTLRGYSRNKLAQLAGCTSRAVLYNESRQNAPRSRNLVRFAEALKVRVDTLAGQLDQFGEELT